jgi:hypothetical protein
MRKFGTIIKNFQKGYLQIPCYVVNYGKNVKCAENVIL